MPPAKTQIPELMVVMPVYNEAECVEHVVLEWHQELCQTTQNFHFLVINDGSTDGTAGILDLLKTRLTNLTVIHQENAGHGQTCLRGYRFAVQRNIPYILQVDSDGQCDPRYFREFWIQRDNCDVVCGKRVKREDGWHRAVASVILKTTLLLWARIVCPDANVPYRLIRTTSIETVLHKIPADFHLANVALAVLLKRNARIRHRYVPIHFRKRNGGQPSARFSQFAFRARQLIQQLKQLD